MPPPVQVALQPVQKPDPNFHDYQPLNPHEETLPAGWSNSSNSKPLPCSIHVSHDVAIRVRDGATLYCDVYRPADIKEPVSAIVSWSPYGKRFNGITMLSYLPWKLGIPDGTLSGLEKFEGLDPAFFCDHGFAVVNVDSRGCGHSDGTIAIMGSQEAEDGYDVIEALAKMPWCSGSIGMAGNSHLAIVQWFIAALQPPSLKAIAPWEACGDLYREQFVRGGIFDAGLFDFIIETNIRGSMAIEDFAEMYRRNPYASSPYWSDKRPDIASIRIPTFISMSYNSFVHTMGATRGWMQVNTPHKWLQVSPWQEWHDLWNVPESSTELSDFFDRFLNNRQNNFEAKTPRVRLSYLRFTDDPVSGVPAKDFPLPNTEYRKLYFTADNSLSLSAPSESAVLPYDSEVYQSCASFTHTFTGKTRLLGLPKAVLYMSCLDSDDMDVYVILRKLDKDGEPLLNLNIPWSSIESYGISRNDYTNIPKTSLNNLMFHMGSMGILRASRRAIDPSRSLHENYPFHTHDCEEYITPGETVRLDIGIWAMGVQYEAGESIRVEVHGQSPTLRGEFPIDNKFPEKASKGTHRVHIGAKLPSHIILPFVEDT
jgi:predicted acyl esterase